MAATPWSVLTAWLGITLGVTSTVAVHLVSLAVSDSLQATHPPHLHGVTHSAERPGASMSDYFELRRRWRQQQRLQTLALPDAGEGLARTEAAVANGAAPGWLQEVEFMAPVVEGQLVSGGHRLQVVGVDWFGGAAPPEVTSKRQAVLADSSLGLDLDEALELNGERWTVARVVKSGVNNGLFVDTADALKLLGSAPEDLSFVALRLHDPWAGLRDWLERLLPGLSAGLPATAASSALLPNQPIAATRTTVSSETARACANRSARSPTQPFNTRPTTKGPCGPTKAPSRLELPGANSNAVASPPTVTHQPLSTAPADLPDWRLQPIAAALPEQQFAKSILFNLGALGMLALLVAWFLIYQVCVVWLRRQETTMLRLNAIGLSAAELAGGFLISTAALGTLATLVGIFGGYGLAVLLVRVSTAGFDALPAVEMSTIVLAKALLSGLGVSLAGAWLAFAKSRPAQEASGAKPPGVLTRPPWLGIGLGAVLVGMGMGFEETGLYGGFAAILAAGLIAAALVAPLLRLLRPRPHRAGGNLLARLAVREATWHEGDLSAALGALILAVGTSIGVGLMVDSFERDFAKMLDQRLAHEFFLELPSQDGEGLAAALRLTHPEAAVQAYGRLAARIQGQAVELGYTDFSAAETARYGYAGALADDEAFASEGFLAKSGLGVGDAIDWGGSAFRIVYAFPGFGEARPRLLVQADAAARRFGTLGFDRISLSGINSAALERWLQDWAPAAEVHARAAMRGTAMQVFDRTFAITRALTLLALIIAVVGLHNAMTALRLNQKANTALLRSLGLNSGEQRRIGLIRGTVLGACALALALPLGWFIGFALCHAINPRAFGWSIDLSMSTGAWLWPMLLGFAAAMVSSLMPTPGESGRAA